MTRRPLPCIPVDLSTFCDVKRREYAYSRAQIETARLLGEAIHGDVMRAMRERTAAIEVWLVDVLREHGVTFEEVATRCVLVTADLPNAPGVAWASDMHVEIDGRRVAPGLRLSTQLVVDGVVDWDGEVSAALERIDVDSGNQRRP